MVESEEVTGEERTRRKRRKRKEKRTFNLKKKSSTQFKIISIVIIKLCDEMKDEENKK